MSIDDVPFGHPDDAIDAIIDVPDQLPAKEAALRAHATQVTVSPDGRALALSNNIALPLAASSTTSWSPAMRAPATIADGKPICLRA